MPPFIFLRGANGLWTVDGGKCDSNPVHVLEQSANCKCMTFSEDGSLLSWCNADSIFLLDTKTMEVIHEVNLPKVVALKFSPRATVLACWSNYTVNREQGTGIPNLHLLDVKSWTIKKSLIQKKQIGWDPEWSCDEGICVRNVNNELHFYENNNFETIANKLHLQKVSAFSLALCKPPYVIATYVPGAKGQPSFARIYQYPNFSGPESMLANKSFFKADRVNFFWNKIGTCLLVLTSTESSDSSYYGEQALHFLSKKGESCFVPPQKSGPVYHVEWTPTNSEFIVIHGYMPAKTTIYNTKCEPVFDFGTGPRNFCSFNKQGNILCLAGFGNLAGNLEFWDMKNKKLIAKTQATDTTYLEWSPDGQHLLTATTAPRLRVGNGIRIWHYSGTLMLQHFIAGHAELWQACWQPTSQIQDFAINVKPVESVVEQPKAQAAAYRPPHARNQDAPRPAPAPLHEYEPPSNAKAKEGDKSVSKNKKKREARKAKAAQEEGTKPQEFASSSETPSSQSVDFNTTGIPEVDKKLRNLHKKVQQIQKLQDQQASGKEMEKNQLEKIKSLDSLLKEIKDLELGNC
ncbi:eukaryotic translation initiation factor 2A-like [Biomphalaria glabrata]|uniref:Eukaryotic translation initiation factor 2A n=1 Tax=Biomphalaria glabrata TaxID=6526 RepID=A0A9W2Z218_BIOGL|nr:eukaryotic translation initiation factor 2A-like [Biomphalaria glabrata]